MISELLPLEIASHLHRADSGCWEWDGRLNADGYGMIGQQRVHRVVYELLVGPIPEGLTIDHLCRVRHCAFPDHLEPVTRGENVLRGEGASGMNARKTHCVYGHEFTEKNTFLSREGWRRCLACRRAWDRARYKPKGLRTHCKHGHEFTLENTKMIVDGKGSSVRVCLTCRRARTSRYKRERKGCQP